MKNECKVCRAPFIARDPNNFHCKSCTQDIQQDITRRIEAAIVKEKAFRLEYMWEEKARWTNRRVHKYPEIPSVGMEDG
jgi:hypothetical protein